MIRQICNIASRMWPKLGQKSYRQRLSSRALASFLEKEGFTCMDPGGAIRAACDISVDGICRPGRPKMMWKKLTQTDCREWKFRPVYPQERPGPEVIKLFPCSTQLSMKFILLINVKMPTIVGILRFMSRINLTFSMINTTFERLNRKFFVCRYFGFHEQLKFLAQLRTKKDL